MEAIHGTGGSSQIVRCMDTPVIACMSDMGEGDATSLATH